MLLLLIALIFSLVTAMKTRPVAFLIVTLLLGPGLLVNQVLKADSGRARPLHTEVFGGDKQFTPAFQPADQCKTNCSFVSGHAGMGFWFLSLAWVARRRGWLYFGIGLGAMVGLGRIVQGAHFLSDVIFSFFTVYFTSLVLAKLFFGTTQITGPDRSS